MIRLILTGYLFILFALPIHARLGESVKDLKRRYGQPLEVEGIKAARTDHYSFRWDRYGVMVTVQEGTSVSEEFTREDKREFTLQEVRLLLVESSEPGLAWTQVDGSTWKQRDRVATWSARSLLVQDKAVAR